MRRLGILRGIPGARELLLCVAVMAEGATLPCVGTCSHGSAMTMRTRGGKLHAQDKLDLENERVADLILKRLGNKIMGDPAAEEERGEGERESGDQKSPGEELDEELDEESKRRSHVCARSVSWDTAHRTALSIQLPDDAWGQIQEFRMHNDREFTRWCFPSVVLVNPFFTPEWMWEAAQALDARLRLTAPFRVRLDSFRVIDHSSSSSIWLVPDAASSTKIQALHSHIMELFPTLKKRVEPLVGGQDPHVVMGHFDRSIEARECADALQASWKAVEFTVDEINVVAHRGHGTDPFESYRIVRIGEPEEEAQEGIFSEAEANLESGSDCDAVVQAWDHKAKKFVPIREGPLGEMMRTEEERRKKERELRKDKREIEMREFFNEPTRFEEECLKRIPEDVKDRIRNLLLEMDNSKLASFLRAYTARHGQDLSVVSRELGFATTGSMFRDGLDFCRITRAGQDLYIRRFLTEEEKAKNKRRARLRRELAAMKARDKVERERLGASQRKLAKAELSVIQKFKKKITPQDERVMQEMTKQRTEKERARRIGSKRVEDPIAQEFFDEFDRAERSDTKESEQEVDESSNELDAGGTGQNWASHTAAQGSEDSASDLSGGDKMTDKIERSVRKHLQKKKKKGAR